MNNHNTTSYTSPSPRRRHNHLCQSLLLHLHHKLLLLTLLEPNHHLNNTMSHQYFCFPQPDQWRQLLPLRQMSSFISFPPLLSACRREIIHVLQLLAYTSRYKLGRTCFLPILDCWAESIPTLKKGLVWAIWAHPNRVGFDRLATQQTWPLFFMTGIDPPNNLGLAETSAFAGRKTSSWCSQM
jgi:hypothetical protein